MLCNLDVDAMNPRNDLLRRVLKRQETLTGVGFIYASMPLVHFSTLGAGQSTLHLSEFVFIESDAAQSDALV